MDDPLSSPSATSPALAEWGSSSLRIRIGVFGHPSSGKELLIHSMSLLRHTDANRKAARGSNDAVQSPPKEADDSTSPPQPVASLSSHTAHDAFLRDAALCLLERGHFCVGGVEVPFPTRTSLRIMCPPSHAHKKESDDPPPSVPPPAADTPHSPASTGEDTVTTRLEVELVNCWSVIADDATVASGISHDFHSDAVLDGRVAPASQQHPLDKSQTHSSNGPIKSPSAPRRAVLFQDLDLVLCDAFIVVFDVTSPETFAACRSIVHHLTQTFGHGDASQSSRAQRATTGADQPPERMPVAIAVIASTHKSSPPTPSTNTTSAVSSQPTPRRISSEQCRQLATTYHVPVFELSLLPHDVSRQRKALERVLQRVLKLLP